VTVRVPATPRSAAPVTPKVAPALSDFDTYLFRQGTHQRLYERLGAHANAGGTRFAVWAPNARSVAVVGDFNNWGLGDTALVAENHNGVWSVSAPVPAGVHRYAFLVNGKQWVADPTAPRAAGDDFGQPSSALVVEGTVE
jgi:1,4-alpha-glucan branching enzyme